MPNDFYTPSGAPSTGSAGSSSTMRGEFGLVEDAFDKLPTMTGNGDKLIGVNTAATALETKTSTQVRAAAGLVIGTDIQAYDATLQSIASLGTAADKMLYTTGVDTWAEQAITAAGRALLDDAAASDQRTTLGLGTWATQSMGQETIWIPAAAMTARLTNGPAAGIIEMTTNKNMVRTLDFDKTTQEFAQFDIRMPKSWNESVVIFIPVWSHAAGATAFGVVWGLDAVAISDNETLDVAFGTEQTSTDTGGTANRLYHGPVSSNLTIAGSPATGDVVQFRIHRNPADASDTLDVDARLHGVVVIYLIDGGNDN